MKPILLFDLDNTILNFDTGERSALLTAFESFGIETNEKMLADYHVINIKHWEKLERGELTRLEVLEGRFDELFALYGIDCTGRLIQTTYEHELGKHYDFMPGAKELLERLYPDNELYIVSNGCAEIQRSRIEGAGLKKYFKAFFVSENIGYDKPQKEFFDYCFAHIPDFSPDRAVVIGDSLTSDISGGINAGLKTCWYDFHNKGTSGAIRPDAVIHDLSELPGALEKLL